MAGGSLRNSLHRRNHKERGQLAHRRKLGHLEKKKDYVLRAKDYHTKQDRIKRLKVKAADKNEDEFYFGMVNERTKDGVHIQDRGNKSMPVDMAKILKSQDGNYIRTMRRAGLKKIDKLKLELGAIADLGAAASKGADDWEDEELSTQERAALAEAGLLPQSSSSSRKRKRGPFDAKHTVFADSVEQARELAEAPVASRSKSDNVSEDVDVEMDLGWVPEKKTKRQRAAAIAAAAAASPPAVREEMSDDDETTVSKPKKQRTELLKELASRLARDKSLRYAERELQMQRLLMGKGRSTKLAGAEKVSQSDDEDETDVFDAPRNKKGKKKVVVDTAKEALWKPREYRWKYDRRR